MTIAHCLPTGWFRWIAAIILLAAVPAAAGIEKGVWEVGGGVSYVDPEYGLDAGWGIGARVAANFSEKWGLELSLDHVMTDVDEPNGPGVNIDQLTLCAVRNFRSETRRPIFLRMGLGQWITNESPFDGNVDSIHLGAGIRFLRGKKFALRYQVGLTFTGDDGTFSGAFGAENVNYDTGFGVSWLLGKAKDSIPAEPAKKP